MKTVIQIVQHLSPGGIEVMALELKKNTKHARTLIVSLEGSKEEAIKRWPRLAPFKHDLIFLNKKSRIDVGLITALSRIMRRENVCAVHTHHIGPLIYGGIAARLISSTKLVHTEHDAWHLENRKRRWIERAIIHMVKPVLVADANAVAQKMNRFLGKNSIHVVHNGIDLQYFSPGNKWLARKKLALPENVTLIGSSGRLEKVKGHRFLIETLSALPDECHLAIAGTGSLKHALNMQARELGLAHRVHFLGALDEMPEFYRALDVFCLPSLNEGFPLSPLEAQACGIPAVVSDTGGCRETLCSRAGTIAQPGCSKSLRRALIYVLNKSNLVSPRPFVERKGNIQRMAEKYASLCGLVENVSCKH